MQARNQKKPPAPNFPNLHDIARHVSHANEILQVAEHTLDRLVQAQVSWKTEYYDGNIGAAKRNRMICLQNKQDLLFLAKEIHSLKTRSASLSERLQNEINLVRGNSDLEFEFEFELPSLNQTSTHDTDRHSTSSPKT